MLTRRTLLKSAATLAATSPKLAFPAKSSLLTKGIPSSGEQIPIIGIGTNRYGVGDNAEALAPLRATLAMFAGHGGSVIDTAPGYRSSESVLGRLIEELDLADRFFIATKCDESGGDTTRTQLAQSEAKLKSGTLDLVAVHSIRYWQQQLPVLQQAKENNMIRYVGITTSRNAQFKEVGEIMQSEKLDFVQLNYSLADRRAEDRLLKIAAERGIAVMVNLAFARGKLFSRVKGQALPAWAAEFDAVSWGQLFLKYVVSHPAVTCAIPGTTKVHHLIDNLGAAMGRLPDSGQRTQIENFFATL